MASAVEIHNNEANGSRLSRLLVNKGTEALRAAFDSMHRPSQLASVLTANKKNLKKLRYKVINPSQWKLLYPPSGSPDSQNFDVTLLTILLRNICGLASPATGWDDEPPDSDTSVAANIARIKFYRNKVYGHITTTEIPDDKFENLWQKISQALEGLGTPKSDLDELKDAPLSPEEGDYIQQLEYCYKKEAELIEISLDTNAVVKDIEAKVRKLQQDFEGKSRESKKVLEVDTLTKCDFSGDIRCHNKMFLPGTRKWLFHKLDFWFSDKDSDSTVMILTAGPGIGKSMFAAKVCQIYAEREQLAACHFCKYNNNSDYRNPRMIIESLARNMCDNVNGFKAKLTEQLKRSHSENTLSDLFRVLLNDPLHALEDCEPMLLVIDALDESQVDSRSEFLELISEEFPKLPQWIKILITSRPELPVQEKLQDFNPVVITPDNSNNKVDLLKYLRDHLSSICDDDSVLQSLALECEGSFLFAYHAQMELKKMKKPLTKENLSEFVPKGLSGFYEKQFGRLRDQLRDLASSKFNLKNFLQVLVAAKGPLPLNLLPECLGLPGDAEYEVRRAINVVMSTILPVYDDCLVVYHKSLVDWLTTDGYKEHAFTVDLRSEHECLWRACKKVFNDIVSSPLSELNTTPLIRYALYHGISHMIQTADEASYDWSVNVKLVHSRLAMKCYEYYEMINEWLEICKNSSLSSVLLHELRWHISLFEKNDVMCKNCALYLQSVANRIDLVGNDCDKRATARALLKEGRYFWFEDLNATALTDRFSFSVSLRTDVACIDVAANKQLIAVGCKDGWISIFKLPNFEELRVFDTGLRSRRRQQNPCQGTLVETDQSVDSPDSDFGGFWSCALSPLGNRLVTYEYIISAEIRLWDVTSGNCLQQLKADGYVDYCHFSECGLFILASSERKNYWLLMPRVEGLQEDEREKHEIFTAWSAITLERVDRRYVLRKSPYDMCPLSEHTQCLFPVTLKCSALTSCYHWHDCIFYHTGARLLKLPIFDQLEIMHRFLNKAIIGCRCFNLDASDVVSAKGQGLYLVPSFSNLNIFNITDQSYSSSCISHLYSIECCCFSPDGSFLATCVIGVPLTVLVWDTRLCKIVQVIQLPLWSAPGCWWSESFFWIYDGDLVKIPFSKERTLDPHGAQRVRTDWKPIKLLTLSDVLIFVDEMYSTKVIGIIDGMVQYTEKLPINDSVNCAAVSHCNSIILAVSPITIYIFKEVPITDSQHWIALNAIHVSVVFSDGCEKVGAPFPARFLSVFDKCFVTRNCTKGVLSGDFKGTFLIFVDLISGKITKKRISCMDKLIYAGNSFYIARVNVNYDIVARDLTSGQVIAKWPGPHDVGKGWSRLISTRSNIITIIFKEFGRVMFLKLRVPEQ